MKSHYMQLQQFCIIVNNHFLASRCQYNSIVYMPLFTKLSGQHPRVRRKIVSTSSYTESRLQHPLVAYSNNFAQLRYKDYLQGVKVLGLFLSGIYFDIIQSGYCKWHIDIRSHEQKLQSQWIKRERKIRHKWFPWFYAIYNKNTIHPQRRKANSLYQHKVSEKNEMDPAWNGF